MTGRRDFIRLMAGAVLVPATGAAPAIAQDVGEDIARQLRRRGYGDIEVSRTLLGRIRVVAQRGNLRREIIINPNSGEILRDLTTDSRTGAASNSLFGDEEERSGGAAGKNEGGNSGRGSDAGASGNSGSTSGQDGGDTSGSTDGQGGGDDSGSGTGSGDGSGNEGGDESGGDGGGDESGGDGGGGEDG